MGTFKVNNINDLLARLRSLGKDHPPVNIQMDIIATHLQLIASRAIKIKDPEIISRLIDLGAIKDERPVASKKQVPVK